MERVSSAEGFRQIVLVDAHRPGVDDALGGWALAFVERLRSADHLVEHLQLTKMQINACTGCWSCWVKTPGRCQQQDDMQRVYPSLIACDLVVLALPLIRGFISASSKAMIDRLIPLALPDVELLGGECMHLLRYEHSPAMAAVLHPEPSDDEDDLALNIAYLRRTAQHMHAQVPFIATLEQALEEEQRHAPAAG